MRMDKIIYLTQIILKNSLKLLKKKKSTLFETISIIIDFIIQKKNFNFKFYIIKSMV
jgi:hypothetical protein